MGSRTSSATTDPARAGHRAGSEPARASRPGSQVVWLVRHACAGYRDEWPGEDADRPLDAAGRVQAERLAGHLAPAAPKRVLTSPTRRCMETVAPLSERLGVPVELSERLGKGRECDALGLIVQPDVAGAVLCTHGEVLAPLLATFRRVGLEVEGGHGDDVLLLKCVAWRLDRGERPLRLSVLPPEPIEPCAHHPADATRPS